jgi:hypothetical protein
LLDRSQERKQGADPERHAEAVKQNTRLRQPARLDGSGMAAERQRNGADDDTEQRENAQERAMRRPSTLLPAAAQATRSPFAHKPYRTRFAGQCSAANDHRQPSASGPADQPVKLYRAKSKSKNGRKKQTA